MELSDTFVAQNAPESALIEIDQVTLIMLKNYYNSYVSPAENLITQADFIQSIVDFSVEAETTPRAIVELMVTDRRLAKRKSEGYDDGLEFVC